MRRLTRAIGLVSRAEFRGVEDALQATRERLEQASQRIAALEAELGRRSADAEAAARTETALEQQVAAALQDLQVAREALVSVEVKLDILEGAANMLDRRTRNGVTAGQ